MKKIAVILDYAHGSDVAGKRSPDGRHLEWRWSRMVGKNIKFILYQKFICYTKYLLKKYFGNFYVQKLVVYKIFLILF